VNHAPLDTPITNGAECATSDYLKLQATIEREPTLDEVLRDTAGATARDLSPLDQSLWQKACSAPYEEISEHATTYGTMHVPVTDEVIAALEHLTQQPWPAEVDTELLCLKVQALIMRERAKKVAA